MTWVVPQGMSEKKIQSELNKVAVLFEKQCKEGIIANNKQTFEKYASYVLNLKERTGAKHKTIAFYKGLLERITPAIGHFKLSELKPNT